MHFNELSIGDWFFGDKQIFKPSCIFMKTKNDEGIILNGRCYGQTVLFNPNMAVEYCAHFSASLEDIMSNIFNEEKINEYFETASYKPIKNFDDIPNDALFYWNNGYFKKFDISSVYLIGGVITNKFPVGTKIFCDEILTLKPSDDFYLLKKWNYSCTELCDLEVE